MEAMIEFQARTSFVTENVPVDVDREAHTESISLCIHLPKVRYNIPLQNV